MCGICGFTGSANPEILSKMCRTIAHRGPDDEGFYADGTVNLASRRLSIVDPLTGKQPVHNETQTIWTVWNGEIYNHQELRTMLFRKGHHFYTDHSDTEVIVHLYEEYGLDFVRELNGMFAIAIYDHRSGKLILTRDRMGVKPLFYASIQEQLVFGSEIKSILQYPFYQKRIDPTALYHYFSLKNIPAPRTSFEGITSLLPGEQLVFQQGKGHEVKRYWRIDFHLATPANRFNPMELQEQIASLLEDAVKSRMVSDVPVGAFLSGGVDSSAVVALMSRYSTQPVKTFALGYEKLFRHKEEDLLYARKVSQYFQTEHHEYIMSSEEVPHDMERVVRSFDQPFSGVTSTYFLSKLIAQHVKVALSGDGADELFGSYLAHRLAQPMERFAVFCRENRGAKMSREQKASLAPFEDRIDELERLFRLSGGDEIKWRCSLTPFQDEEKIQLLAHDFVQQVSESTYRLTAHHFEQMTTLDPLNRMLELDWNTLLPDQVLAFVDFLSMAHSIEVRSPFLDYRLVELVASIPGNLKIQDGNVKDLLKKTVAPWLPPGIVSRPKEGFVLPVFDWIKEELKEYVLDMLAESRIKKSGLLNSGEVTRIVSRFYDGDLKLVSKVWNLAMFQAWWEIYFG